MYYFLALPVAKCKLCFFSNGFFWAQQRQRISGAGRQWLSKRKLIYYRRVKYNSSQLLYFDFLHSSFGPITSLSVPSSCSFSRRHYFFKSFIGLLRPHESQYYFAENIAASFASPGHKSFSQWTTFIFFAIIVVQTPTKKKPFFIPIFLKSLLFCFYSDFSSLQNVHFDQWRANLVCTFRGQVRFWPAAFLFKSRKGENPNEWRLKPGNEGRGLGIKKLQKSLNAKT